MNATVLGDAAASEDSAPGSTPSGRTGTDRPAADTHIAGLRDRIDEIDAAIIQLWQERAAISQEVGATRVASGGTRLVLSREREIMDRYRAALGADGTQLALLVLRAGRGRL
ncbi:MAG: chorismate mutase [Micromonosporaceae bacterium]|nr:chorismate mutase [Micromonosporaceae bacterium]